jgi:hypothetical protein
MNPFGRGQKAKGNCKMFLVDSCPHLGKSRRDLEKRLPLQHLAVFAKTIEEQHSPNELQHGDFLLPNFSDSSPVAV